MPTSVEDIFDLADTWNDGATLFSAIKMDVTDTASNALSRLLDLQVGGVDKAFIDKTGLATFASGVQLGNGVMRDASGNGFMSMTASGHFGPRSLTNWGIRLNNTSQLSYSSGVDGVAGIDTVQLRDAAGVVGQRSTTQAQGYRPYNTYTDASNYEYGTVGWASNELTIKAVAAGTGTLRDIRLGVHKLVSSTNSVELEPNASVPGITIGKVNNNHTGIQLYNFGTPRVSLNPYHITVSATGAYRFSSGNDSTTGIDTQVNRDAAGVLGILYPSAAADCGLQIYNDNGTWTASGNFERVNMKWVGDVFEIKAAAGGTGTARVLHISTLPTSNPGPGILWNNAGTPAIGT